MNKKSILHVANIYFVLPYFIGDQFMYFNEKGYKLHVICSPSEEILQYSQKMNFKYSEIPILRSFSLYQDIKSIVAVCKYIKKNKIDIVCGHTPKGALIAMLASFLMRVKVRIYFRHGILYETSSGLKKTFLKYMERFTSFLSTSVVAVSQSIFERSLEDKLTNKEKLTVLNNGSCNGINSQKFSKESINIEILNNIKKKYKLNEESYVVGYSGRLVKDKGISELVNSFEELQTKYDNLYLLLVGMSEERDTLPKNIVNKINTNNHIIATGYVDYEMMKYYYAMMNLFVLPSYREGLPTSVLEASSMEVPVITSRATGCIDSIIESKTGILVNQNNPKELAQAINFFFMNPELAIEYGKNGREFVSKEFEQESVWNSLEDLYKTNS
jgi:glycosyltransferase involved in cell wall biosynthesis